MSEIHVRQLKDVLLIVEENRIVFVTHLTVSVVRTDQCDSCICTLFVEWICMSFDDRFVFFFAHVGDICIPNPCLNGGTCQTQGLLGFTCQCRPGFQGLTCQICECFLSRMHF